ncbi:MAG TPA: ABC transporter ATP-binding protein [Chloroflexota bacterium]|jgi:ABC-type branched-subunit amino acid transport system ATPase component
MSDDNGAVLSVCGVVAGYGDEDILHGVSLDVPSGKVVAVIGPNGSGKSTLLKSIYGLLHPRQGSVIFRDRSGQSHDLAGMQPYAITRLGINFVPQLANVFADLSVRENLEVGAFVRAGRFQDQLERVLLTFPALGTMLRARAATLSGGQRQMLGIARALISDPHVLILDEPSAGLAPSVVDTVFSTIKSINASGVSILMVEQKARQCLSMSDFGYVLDMGQNRIAGTGEQLLHDPEVIQLYLGNRGRLGVQVYPGRTPAAPASGCA